MTRLTATEHFDLHNDDGTHRSTCSSTNGTRLAQHEAAILGHQHAHRLEVMRAERVVQKGFGPGVEEVAGE